MIILEKNPSIQIVLMFTLLGVLLTSVTSPLHTLPSHLEEEQPVTSHYEYELVTSHREEQPVNSCCQSNHNTILSNFSSTFSRSTDKKVPRILRQKADKMEEACSLPGSPRIAAPPIRWGNFLLSETHYSSVRPFLHNTSTLNERGTNS